MAIFSDNVLETDGKRWDVNFFQTIFWCFVADARVRSVVH